MTFTINGTDFSSYIQVYGYSTEYKPVYSQSVQTIDGVEHVAVVRYRGSVAVNLRPLTAAQWAALSSVLATGILTVTYTCIQRNTDVTAYMKLDTMSANTVLKNASRTLYGDTQLSLTEL